MTMNEYNIHMLKVRRVCYTYLGTEKYSILLYTDASLIKYSLFKGDTYSLVNTKLVVNVSEIFRFYNYYLLSLFDGSLTSIKKIIKATTGKFFLNKTCQVIDAISK